MIFAYPLHLGSKTWRSRRCTKKTQKSWICPNPCRRMSPNSCHSNMKSLQWLRCLLLPRSNKITCQSSVWIRFPPTLPSKSAWLKSMLWRNGKMTGAVASSWTLTLLTWRALKFKALSSRLRQLSSIHKLKRTECTSWVVATSSSQTKSSPPFPTTTVSRSTIKPALKLLRMTLQSRRLAMRSRRLVS